MISEKILEKFKKFLPELYVLRFAVPPLAALFLMNGLLDFFIFDIGNISTESAQLHERFKTLPKNMVALSEGRFRFMTFFLVASVLYPGFILFNIWIIWRNIKSYWAIAVVLSVALASALWIFSSLIAPDKPTSTTLLFTITEKLALSRYDLSFATRALLGAKVHFAMALVGVLMAILAGCFILRDMTADRILLKNEIESKRRDLKMILFIASVFLTFIAIYVSEWIAWPATFVEARGANSKLTSTGFAEEVRSLASGLRLYFGTGYSLILLAFAVPAINVFSRYLERHNMEINAPEGTFLLQRVFTREEFGIIASIAAPLAVPFLSSALGVT